MKPWAVTSSIKSFLPHTNPVECGALKIFTTEADEIRALGIPFEIVKWIDLCCTISDSEDVVSVCDLDRFLKRDTAVPLQPERDR